MGLAPDFPTANMYENTKSCKHCGFAQNLADGSGDFIAYYVWIEANVHSSFHSALVSNLILSRKEQTPVYNLPTPIGDGLGIAQLVFSWLQTLRDQSCHHWHCCYPHPALPATQV